MRILGIDPGVRATGYGVVDFDGSALRCVASGVIRPKAGSLAMRLCAIQQQLQLLIDQFRPDGAAIENVFSSRNVRSALTLGHVRGVALATLAGGGLDAGEYAASQVKAAVVGHGSASKSQVQQMVRRLLALPAAPPADAADALAIAICHGHTYATRRSRAVSRPARGNAEGGGVRGVDA